MFNNHSSLGRIGTFGGFLGYFLVNSPAAITLFDNFGPYLGYQYEGITVGNLPPFLQIAAASFTVQAPQSCFLSSVVAPMLVDTDLQPALWTLSVASDNSGLPGNIIASSSALVGTIGLYSFDFGGSVELSAGGTYWLIATAANGSEGGWMDSNVQVSSGNDDLYSTTLDPPDWLNTGHLYRPAFSVEGTAIPEPMSLPLGTAVIGVFATLLTRSPRRAIR